MTKEEAVVEELEVTTQAAEESQPEETITDVVVEEELDVQEEVEPAEEPKAEPLEEKVEEPAKEKEEIPFIERPGIKERLAEIDEKYGSKANYWDTITEISQSDPAFRVLILEKLEASGKLPAGTVEAFKKKTSSLKESEAYVSALPEDVQEDLKAAREIRLEKQAATEQNLKQAEAFFASFEEAHPEIAASPNPKRTRNLIFTFANELVEREGIEFADAMERAQGIVLKPNKGVNQEIEAAVQANKEDASGITTGVSTASTKLRKLTQGEKRGAELAGMTPEEYIRFKDASEEDIFENI